MFCFRYYLFPIQSKYQNQDTLFYGMVTSIKQNEDYYKIEIEAKEKLIAFYYNKALDGTITIGSMVRVEGTLEQIPDNTIPNLYSWSKFYRSQNAFYYLTIQKIEKVKDVFSLKQLFLKQMNRSKQSSPYLKALFLGDTKDLEDEVKESYQVNGINHLLAISGMHLSLITSKLKKYPKAKVSILVLTFLLLGKNVSYLRAIIFYILNCFLPKKYKVRDKILLTIGLLLWINPYYVDQVGFWYTTLLSSAFLLLMPKQKDTSFFKKRFMNSLFAFLVGIPLSLWFFYKINLFTPILNVFFIPFFCSLVVPLLILTFFIPKLDSLCHLILSLFEQFSIKCSTYLNGTIILGKPSFFALFVWLIWVFHLILFLYYKRRKVGFLLLILSIFLLFLTPTKEEVVFLDVGQGDASYLSSNGKRMLMDTGNKKGKDLISFLESKGTTTLDYLILTHGDSDHLDNALLLMEHFNIGHLIYNPGEVNLKETEVLSLAREKNISTSICYENENFKMGKFSFYSLTQEGVDENSNSCIYYVTYPKLSFLFTGDMTKENEDLLMKKYRLPSVTYLKVAHHGSKTSSSLSFLSYLRPTRAIISVGKNNLYHHPSPITIQNLEKAQIPYDETSKVGSIQILLKHNTVLYYPPYTIKGR